MIKVKYFILFAALILLGYSAKSQSEGISYRLHSGLNLQTFNGKDVTGDKLNLNIVPRFNVGAMIDFHIVSNLYIKSGLLFTTKGAKSNQFQGTDLSVEYNIAYIELPINLLFKAAMGKGHILLGFGPYIAYGIVGSAEYTIVNTTVVERIDFTNKYESLNALVWNNIKPFDYGGNLFCGYELKSGFSWHLNTQLGMAKINAENRLLSSKAILKNRGYGLSIEYKF